jgi:rhodanese-related sulfurtransferase
MIRLFKVIDLRSNVDVKRLGKVIGSKNIPFDRFLELTRDKKIKNENLIVYCRSGARSRRAAFTANLHGYNCKDFGGFSNGFRK